MAAKYPGELPVYNDLKITDKSETQGKIQAATTNPWLDEIIAICTELGIDVAGDASDLATRLAVYLHKHDYQDHIVTAEDVANGYINLTGGKTYYPGDNSLIVIHQGLELTITTDYTETSASRITFLNDMLTEGDIVKFRWWKSG